MNQIPTTKKMDSLADHNVLILAGEYAGEEGICLGRIAGINRWAVSPHGSIAILELRFESEFALLVNLSVTPSRN